MNCKLRPGCFLFFFLLFLLNAGKSTAQSPFLKLNGSKLEIVNPTKSIILTSPSTNVDSNQKTYLLWAETGDGNYVTDFSSGLVLSKPPVVKYTPLLMATKLYERNKRPPPTSGSTVRINTFSTNSTVMQSPNLPAGKSIVLFSNVNSVMPLDPMVFAMSYRPSAIQGITNPAYRVTFRYNIGDMNIFEPVTRDDQKHSFPDVTQSRSTEINDVRRFANENIFAINKPALPAGSKIGYSRESNMADSIVFITTDTSTSIKNIFITLFPNDIDPANLPPVRLEAILQKRESAGNVWTTVEISVLELGMAYAHDPNNITVFPSRLTLPQQNTKLHYTINFENTGNGNAEAVKVVFFCPQRMKWDSVDIRRNVKARFSEISDFRFKTEDIVFDTIHKKIVFTLNPNGTLIEGLSPHELPVPNDHRTGKVEFDIIAPAEENPNLSTTIEAWADIYFKGEASSPDSVSAGMIRSGRCLTGTESFEFPVRTLNASAIYYRCDNQPPCNCQNPRGLWRRLGCAWKALFH